MQSFVNKVGAETTLADALKQILQTTYTTPQDAPVPSHVPAHLRRGLRGEQVRLPVPGVIPDTETHGPRDVSGECDLAEHGENVNKILLDDNASHLVDS